MTDTRNTNSIHPGARVVFRDSTATVSDDQEVTRTGVCNGEPIGVYVPVFAERDNGREATTVMVHANNIVSIA